MPARSKLSCYATVCGLAFKQLMGAGWRFLCTWLATTVVLAAVTMTLYVAAYKAAPQSLPLASVTWSIAIASYLRLTWRHLTGNIGNDVRTGAIAMRIRYPMSYLGYNAAEHLGMSPPTVVPFLCLAAYIAGGLPQIPHPGIALPVFVLMLAGSFSLSLCMYTLMGLVAFWIEDPMPVLRIVEKLALVTAGSVIPLTLLPDAARRVVEFVPLAATGFPAQVTSPDFLVHAPRLLAIEFGWLVVFGVMLAVVWRRAQRRIEVNGG